MSQIRNILFIIDAQNDFCSEGGSLVCENYKETVSNICKLIKNNRFDEVICTKDTHGKNYGASREGQKLPIPHCIKGMWGCELNKDIYDALYGRMWSVIEKPRFMVPFDDLNELNSRCCNLRFGGVMQHYNVYMCGFATDICVLNNALAVNTMSFVGYNNIRIIEPCCAGTTKENHDKAIELMKINQIDIITDLGNIKLKK